MKILIKNNAFSDESWKKNGKNFTFLNGKWVEPLFRKVKDNAGNECYTNMFDNQFVVDTHIGAVTVMQNQILAVKDDIRQDYSVSKWNGRAYLTANLMDVKKRIADMPCKKCHELRSETDYLELKHEGKILNFKFKIPVGFHHYCAAIDLFKHKCYKDEMLDYGFQPVLSPDIEKYASIIDKYKFYSPRFDDMLDYYKDIFHFVVGTFRCTYDTAKNTILIENRRKKFAHENVSKAVKENLFSFMPLANAPKCWCDYEYKIRSKVSSILIRKEISINALAEFQLNVLEAFVYNINDYKEIK